MMIFIGLADPSAYPDKSGFVQGNIALQYYFNINNSSTLTLKYFANFKARPKEGS